MDLFIGIDKLDASGARLLFYAKTGFMEGPVAMGWQRVSLRDLNLARSTPQQALLSFAGSQPISEGEIMPVEIEILPSSTLFRAGDSLQLTVQGRDLFDHPMLHHADTVNAVQHVLQGGRTYDPHLPVPVIPLR